MDLPAGQQYIYSVEEQALAVDPWEINLRQVSGGPFLGNMHIASLELSFKQCLGITPRQYLSLQRMHGVHTELLQRAPHSRCVTEVATAWGFSELGRFAGEYKRVFGELPTHTLNREQQRTLRCFRDLLH